MTPSESKATHGGRSGSRTDFEHLVSEASAHYVALVGKHDIDAIRPDVPTHLIEITRVELVPAHERSTAGAGPDSDRDNRSELVRQFLAD